MRSKQLDFLRGIAVVLVLFRHITPPPETALPLARFPVMLLYEAGWAGVDLFFVLSGFLISGLLFREQQTYGRIDFGRFIIRRGFKIYPPFYTLIAATMGIALISGWNMPWKRIMAEVFFVQNYFEGIWGLTWSLAVEEHFYLMLPLLLIFLIRLNPGSKDPFRSLLWIYPVLALLTMSLRFYTTYRSAIIPQDVGVFCRTFIFPTHLRIDALFLGVIVSYAWHYHGRELEISVKKHRIGLIVFAFAALFPLLLWPLMANRYHYTLGFAVYSLGFASVLLLVMTAKAGANNRLADAWSYIGAHSYSIYLWHMAVALVLQRVFHRWHTTWWLEESIYIVLSIVAGIVLAKLVELPVLHIRDRWFPSRSRALAQTPGA